MAYSGSDSPKHEKYAFLEIPEDLPEVRLKGKIVENPRMAKSAKRFNEVMGRKEKPLAIGQMMYVLDLNWDKLSKEDVIDLTGHYPGVIRFWRSAYDLPDAPDYELGSSLPESEKDISEFRDSVDYLLSKIFRRGRHLSE